MGLLLYLKLDDIEPRVFKAGKDGFQEIDYMNFNGETNAETEDKDAENIMDANYIPKENE